MNSTGEPDAGNLLVRFDGGAVAEWIETRTHRITRQRSAARALLLEEPIEGTPSPFLSEPEGTC